MANEEHLAILKQGVKGWNKWREENRDIRPDLSRVHLIAVDLSGADLSGADLSGTHFGGALFIEADLHSANLRLAYLNGADLSGANLQEAYLREAHLISANLIGADLSEAHLISVDLSEADLSGADLSGTELRLVNLSEADLRIAICVRTQFSGLDLSQVIGLDAIKHRGPSTIGIDTLYRSKGNIPEVFLRGCGIPDDFITFIPSLTCKPFDFYSCFISYSHSDKLFARRIHDTLQGRGIRCWLDEHQLVPGDLIHKEIDRGIRLRDKVLLCCSETSMRSWWVEKEFNQALQKEEDLRKQRGESICTLIPLDLDGHIFSPDCDNWIAREVKTRLAADFKGWEHDNAIFEREIEQVIRALRMDRGKELPPESRL